MVILSLVVLLYSALILLVPEDILIKNKACTIFFICHLWDNKPSIFSYAVKVYMLPVLDNSVVETPWVMRL